MVPATQAQQAMDIDLSQYKEIAVTKTQTTMIIRIGFLGPETDVHRVIQQEAHNLIEDAKSKNGA